jgi:large subunit ribosomal protein L13
MKHTLDATNKKIGRVASEAAKLLMGKNTTDFARNTITEVEVEIVHASKADVPTTKLKEEMKASYTEYPSGIKTPTVGSIIQSKGHKELFRRAVSGMLPRNKLRSKMMKHLKISE